MARKTLAILLISVFATSLGYGIIAPLLPLYAEDLGATGVWVGIIFSAFAASRAFVMPIMGRLSDEYGRRNFINIGLLAYTVFSVSYVFTSSVYTLTLIRLLHGVASAIVTPVAMAYLGDIVPKGHEGEFMGRFNTCFFIGFALGPLLAGYITENYYIDISFYVMGGLGALGLVMSALFLPESPSYKKTKQAPFGFLLRDSCMQGIFILRAVQSIGIAAYMSFLPIYSQRIELTYSQIGLLLGVTYILWAMMNHPFGILADKYDRPIMMVSGSVIMAVAIFLIPFSTTFFELFAIVLSRAVGGAIVLAAATAMTTQIGREHGMGSTMGIFNTSMAVGMLLGGVISGSVMDYIGLDYVFYMASFYYILGVIAFWWLVVVRGKRGN
ncbi:MAG: MFS transporter [Halobacteriota archaeon]|nr:MFS transporter [Halobacteriota archaeon]